MARLCFLARLCFREPLVMQCVSPTETLLHGWIAKMPDFNRLALKPAKE